LDLAACPCGELSAKCGYVQRNHHKIMKAEDGKQITWQFNTNSVCYALNSLHSFISKSFTGQCRCTTTR